MSAHDIRAVLFDLGETLLNFGKVKTTRLFYAGAKSTYAFLREQGCEVGGFMRYFLQNLARLRVRYLLSHFTKRDFDALTWLRDVGQKKGVNLKHQQWQQLAWLWYEPLSKMAKVEPTIKETLAGLKGLGLKLGILSNTFINRHSLERHLRQLGILDFFCVQLYSHEFAFRKPDLRIFKVAAERIAEPAENILYVGDRIDNDIQPALHSGMKAVLKNAYTNLGKQTPQGAARVSQIAELPALIEQINTTAAAT